MSKGSELDKQIYEEGVPTWGCKSGVLDVEDVKKSIKSLRIAFVHGTSWESKFVNKTMKEIFGDALVGEGVA